MADNVCTERTGGQALTGQLSGLADGAHEARIGRWAEEARTGPRKRIRAD